MQKKDTNPFVINRLSFNSIYKEYYTRLCRFVYYYVNCKLQAEEIVQDFFTGLWEKRKKVRIETNIESYLYIAVKNAAFSKLKKNINTNTADQKAINYGCEPTLDTDAFKRKLEKAILKLPEKCRLIYCLKYIEGLTVKEIAHYLEISEKTVETQTYRALQKLRTELAPFRTEFFNSE